MISQWQQSPPTEPGWWVAAWHYEGIGWSSAVYEVVYSRYKKKLIFNKLYGVSSIESFCQQHKDYRLHWLQICMPDLQQVKPQLTPTEV